MTHSHHKDREDVALRDLYPRLTDDELKEAEENIQRYVELALRINDRLHTDRLANPLTAAKRHSTISSKVESS